MPSALRFTLPFRVNPIKATDLIPAINLQKRVLPPQSCSQHWPRDLAGKKHEMTASLKNERSPGNFRISVLAEKVGMAAAQGFKFNFNVRTDLEH